MQVGSRMKLKAWTWIVAPAAALAPLSVVACDFSGGFTTQTDGAKNYDILWNTAFFKLPNETPSAIYNLTIEELETRINAQINSSAQARKLLKLFAFTSLYQAVKNPYNREGQRVDIADEALKKFGDFLSDQMKPDQADETDDKKKTYRNFDRFIESFNNVKISVLAFEPTTTASGRPGPVLIDKSVLLGEELGPKLLERLHFQLSFKINNARIHELVVSNNEPVFHRTQKNREERIIIKNHRNSPAVLELIENQFKYQGTKMYYDLPSQEFRSIILTSNVKYNTDKDTTPSGFIGGTDTTRKLFFFDFKQIGRETYQNYLILDLANSAYFDPFLQTNFNNYLKTQQLYVDSKMKRIEINLKTTINYKEYPNESET